MDTGQPIADCDDEPGPEPEIDIDPRSIDFGEVDPAVMAEINEAVSVCNLGTRDDVHIQNIELRDANAAFGYHSIQSVLLEPGQCTSFEIRFQPQAGVVSEDVVIIDCDDEDCDGCPKELPVRGEGTLAR